jgi:signal peptidase II
MSKLKGIVFLGFFLLCLDQLLKYFTHHFLPLMSQGLYLYPYSGISVFHNFLGIEFSISHATNTGAAWGAFADKQGLLLIFRVILITVLAVYLFSYNQKRSIQVPLALVLFGATANVLDYFIYGHVVDMFHFVLWGYDYPVFNLADSMIFIGVLCLLLTPDSKKEKKAVAQ